MKRVILIFAVIFPLGAFAQTTGSVQGTITTSDGTAAEYVTVSIKGTSKGAVADQEGFFEIKNLSPGTYTLVASFLGLEGQTQSLEIKAGEVSTVNFTLKE